MTPRKAARKKIRQLLDSIVDQESVLEGAVMRYEVTFHGQVSMTTDRVTPPPAEELEVFVDEVVGELEELAACDIDVSTDLMQGTVRVSVSVDTHGIERAQEEGSARIRAAFHAAGASTPDWSVEWMAVSTAAQDQVNA